MTLLGKDDVKAILEKANKEPISIPDLSDECDIPLSSTYHYVDQLVEEGVLTKDTKIDPDGNNYNIYKCEFNGCFIYLDDGELRKDILQDDEYAERMVWIWKQLRDI